MKQAIFGRATRLAAHPIPTHSVHTFMIAALSITALSIFSGCMTFQPTPISSFTKEAMQSWVGHTDSELIFACGKPTSVHPMPNGTRVYEYELLRNGWYFAQEKRVVQDKIRKTVLVAVPTGGTTVHRDFIVSAYGVIVDWLADAE
ncbi:MAG: hypothetical protein ABI444_07185 [Candidatus Kapaibacterium sp.]|jgi:hypothetical protein